MLYRAIGLMSGSSLDGLDIAYAEFSDQGGNWTYEIKEAACYSYEDNWANRLRNAISLSAYEYQLLHTEYGCYLGKKINHFIREKTLQYQAGFVASHGHTVFHVPSRKMTAQLGDGAAIAAETGLPVVSDLRAMDVALGGQGAPIVPIGEKLLMPGYDFFLNIGGICNLSAHINPYSSTTEYSSAPESFLAFDICPANRVLNMLANEAGKDYDDDGKLAATGTLHKDLLGRLNSLDYYLHPAPKSLANEFGTQVIYPMIRAAGISIPDALRTCTEHIVTQISKSVTRLTKNETGHPGRSLLVTGGGAHNKFLIRQLSASLQTNAIDVIVPDSLLVNYKEAMIMAFIGVLRWRQQPNVLASVTGASADSVGGALWFAQEQV